jgi:hypothetical protein
VEHGRLLGRALRRRRLLLLLLRAAAAATSSSVLAFGNRIVLVFSRLVELSPTATGKAQQRNAPGDVFAKDALCSELLAGAGVDIPSGQHVLLLVAVPGRGGLMDPTADASTLTAHAGARECAAGAASSRSSAAAPASSSSSTSTSTTSPTATSTTAFPCCAPPLSRRRSAPAATAAAPSCPRALLRAHVLGPVCPRHNDASRCEAQVLAWAAASASLPPCARPRYVVLALKMSGARCGFVRRMAAAHRPLAASAHATCRDMQRGSADHDGLMTYEGTYMERTDSCVSRFATAEGCSPALLLAHASARADLAARLALFERALFPAGAAVRDACAARGRGDARFLEPGLARRGVRFSAFCFSEDMNNRLHVDAGRANEAILQCARDPAARRPRSWTFVCAAAGASFRLDGDDAEFGAVTIQPSFVLHGTPRVTCAAARAANAEAGLLGVAGFAKAAVLGAVLLEEGGGAGGEALPAAERDAARDTEEGTGMVGGRGGRVKRRRGER